MNFEDPQYPEIESVRVPWIPGEYQEPASFRWMNTKSDILRFEERAVSYWSAHSGTENLIRIRIDTWRPTDNFFCSSYVARFLGSSSAVGNVMCAPKSVCSYQHQIMDHLGGPKKLILFLVCVPRLKLFGHRERSCISWGHARTQDVLSE